MSDVISVRLPSTTKHRLERAAKASGESRSALVNRILEEGLRMQGHPGIEFRAGPAGRRPAIKGGPDVWEVARYFHNSPVRGDALRQQIVDELRLSHQQVDAVIGYYAEFSDEIDDWLVRLDRQADQAQAIWLKQQAILG
jgi:hypothetical protein